MPRPGPAHFPVPDPYRACLLCPRRCGVDRTAGGRGFCGEDAGLRIASASIHRGEEPPVTGTGGSGTVFISGCNLGCTFCQNHQISGGNPVSGNPEERLGRTVSTEEFAAICLALQERGAENINIVTGSHAVPALVRGINAARSSGLRLPVLWNSSSYESAEALSLLRDTVDVYLPDLKTLDSVLGDRFFRAPGYPEYAAAAIKLMMEYRSLAYGSPGPPNRAPVLVSGVIIRHLVLPGYLESTRQVLRWFADHARGRALLSLMTQYTPVGPEAGKGDAIPDRFLSPREYETVLGWLEEFGIDDGFYQELIRGSDWLPDFRRENPFSSELSLPVWHWKSSV